MFTVVGEMQGEMVGTRSTSGSRACCRVVFFLPPGQSTLRRSPAPAVRDNVHTHVTYTPGSNFSNPSIMCKSCELN